MMKRFKKYCVFNKCKLHFWYLWLNYCGKHR